MVLRLRYFHLFHNTSAIHSMPGMYVPNLSALPVYAIKDNQMQTREEKSILLDHNPASHNALPIPFFYSRTPNLKEKKEISFRHA